MIVPSKVGKNGCQYFFFKQGLCPKQYQTPSISPIAYLAVKAMARALRERDKDKIQNMSTNHVMADRWDDWVPQDRVRKFTPENKELAAQLHNQMKALQQRKPVGKQNIKRGANGSDFSSARDSEERMGSVAATGRGGPRRNRDYDLEHVSRFDFFCFSQCRFGPCCHKKRRIHALASY
jgi:hypothetical protein